jgi:quercetin dioxygenase-like cupin family protein
MAESIAQALARLLDALGDALAAAALDEFAALVRGIDPAARWPGVSPRARLPVCRCWNAALVDGATRLADPLRVLAPALAWTQNPNYRRRPPDPAFLDNYGYAVLAGPADGPPALARAERVALGVLLLAPDTHYPLHAHPAVEVYVTLTPDGEWWRDPGPWRREPAGAVIHHAPGVRHATRAGATPVLALYVWRGALATHARLAASRALTSRSAPTRRSSPARAGARTGGRRARGTRGRDRRRGRRPGRP